jgi:hypothetical protein
MKVFGAIFGCYSETTLKRYVAMWLSSAPHLDKQDDFKVEWLYTSWKTLSASLKNRGQLVFQACCLLTPV